MNTHELLIKQARLELQGTAELIDKIKSGKVKIVDVYWFGITDFWDFHTTENICRAIDDPAKATQIIAEVLDQAAEYDTKPPQQYVYKCEVLKRRYERQCTASTTTPKPATSAERKVYEDSTPTAQFIKSKRGEKVLKALEQMTNERGKKVLDRSVEPWKVSTLSEWGAVARYCVDEMKIGRTTNQDAKRFVDWEAWERLAGIERGKLKRAYTTATKNGNQPASHQQICKLVKSLV